VSARRDAALDYAAAGMPVFPLAGKKPRNDNGLTGASADMDKVADWWRRWPDADVGIATGQASGFVVLDVDGAAGLRSIVEIEKRHGTIRTAQVLTGSGGRHYWFRCPDEPLRNSVKAIGDGLDIRGDGGYVVGPPSVHESGNVYRWTRELEHVADCPAWLIEDARSQRNGAAPEIGEIIPIGEIDSTLASLAGSMRRRGMDEKAILAALVATLERCEPGHTHTVKDCERIAASVARYAPAPASLDLRPKTDEGLWSLSSLSSQAWPDALGDAAYHGVTGEFVRLVEPHSEADPAAVLVQFLISVANMIGRGPHFTAGARRHYTNMNAVVVGKTAKGRKGTSFAPTVSVLGAVDAIWESERRQSGLSSGEGLIHAVRDPVTKIEDGQEKVVDDGVTDKRLLVVEEEFASVLKMLQRDGNTLSTTLRQAFDDGRLRTLTRQAPIKATGAHFSIVGHITLEELRRELTATDAMSGLANRFLWVLAQRSKLLPDGGEFHKVDIAPIVRQLNVVVTFARKRGTAEYERDTETRTLWHDAYAELSRDVPGLLGAAIARAEAITMRLALIYALLDCSPQIRHEHLQAGLEVWRYCRDSAAVIFGARTGDDYADRIEGEFERKEQLTRTEIRDLFGRHAKVARIESAIELLVDLDRAELVEEATGGRPAQVLRPKRPKRPKAVA
jgi:hypothetical protein